MTITRIISGGQTGADRGGLDAALALGIPIGGKCPRGRLAEDGTVPELYTLEETTSDKYPPRTAANIKESDATLVFSHGIFDRGTGLTLRMAENMGKPHARINLRPGVVKEQVEMLRSWLRDLRALLGRDIIINVAGPRESRAPGLQEHVRDFLIEVLRPMVEINESIH